MPHSPVKLWLVWHYRPKPLPWLYKLSIAPLAFSWRCRIRSTTGLLTFFLSGVSLPMQQCMMFFATLLAQGGARHLLAIHPQLVSSSFFTGHYSLPGRNVPHMSHFGISYNCLVDGYLSHTPRMFPKPLCRTCMWPSVVFARMAQTQIVELASPWITTAPYTGVSSLNHHYVPSTSAWWFFLTLAPLSP